MQAFEVSIFILSRYAININYTRKKERFFFCWGIIHIIKVKVMSALEQQHSDNSISWLALCFEQHESEYQQLAASRVSERNVWESLECSSNNGQWKIFLGIGRNVLSKLLHGTRLPPLPNTSILKVIYGSKSFSSNCITSTHQTKLVAW